MPLWPMLMVISPLSHLWVVPCALVMWVASPAKWMWVRSSPMKIVLKDENKSLDEVVVVGYGVRKTRHWCHRTGEWRRHWENSTPWVRSLPYRVRRQAWASRRVRVCQVKVSKWTSVDLVPQAIPLHFISSMASRAATSIVWTLPTSRVWTCSKTQPLPPSMVLVLPMAWFSLPPKQGKAGNTDFLRWIHRFPKCLSHADLLNAKEYAMIMNEERYEDGLTPRFRIARA